MTIFRHDALLVPPVMASISTVSIPFTAVMTTAVGKFTHPTPAVIAMIAVNAPVRALLSVVHQCREGGRIKEALKGKKIKKRKGNLPA